MNTPDDLARQKRDYDEQIFRDRGAEMKQAPTPRTQKTLEATQGLFRAAAYANGFADFARTLETENAILLAHNEAMRKALLDMIIMATQEGWNTPLYLPEFGNALKAAREAVDPTPTK